MESGLAIFNEGGIVAIDVDKQISLQPSDFRLDQNYPNPFNPITTISYDLPEQATVSLRIFDIQGHEITTLQESEKPPGNYEVQWNGVDQYGNPVSTGVYFCRFTGWGIQGDN